MNKNTKYRFSQARKQFRKSGESVITIEVGKNGPRQTFHFAAKSNGNQTISVNEPRNMAMRVYKNKGTGKAGNNSLTRHEPLVEGKPGNPVKKKYTNQ